MVYTTEYIQKIYDKGVMAFADHVVHYTRRDQYALSNNPRITKDKLTLLVYALGFWHNTPGQEYPYNEVDMMIMLDNIKKLSLGHGQTNIQLS